ncbi:glycosyltransferase [Halomonas halocynthiae]|uniref:glycosyltransferase n=1 Tax=Halomonas halocynthiae TaxID=176290 RepID=UPI001969DA10|nr:glycosyltransferase [Halomonas halocynthiae]
MADESSTLTTHPYQQPVELPFTLPTRVYSGMLLVWLLRPVLQRRFPLHKGKRSDYFHFLAWCTSIGRRQYQLLREIDAWNHELMQPLALPALKGCRWQSSYTVGMYLAGMTRTKYWSGQLLYNRTMRHRAARWYFRDGRRVLGLPGLPDWQRQSLVDGFDTPQAFVDALLLPKDRKQDGEQPIRDGVADVVTAWTQPWAPEPLKAQFPNSVPRLSQWLGRWLPLEANELVWLKNELLLRLADKAPSINDINQVMQAVPIEKSAEIQSPSDALPWGVNLVGYARGELGIGEDVRMVARALEVAKVPFCILNVEPGANVSQKDATVEHWIVEKPVYAMNLFCMTGIEMARMTAEKGLSLLIGRYNIGLWPWELPTWPTPWHHAWNLVDELWGISHYTAQAYADAPVPVLAMPLPVVVDRVAELGRGHWGLPQDAYLFVFSFDMNSTLARKNPIATVNAFLEAFEESPDERVGLVVKVSHLNTRDPRWKPLAKLMKRDPRIVLIRGELRKNEVLALYRCCDCFVSLHRSEGFGRSLAEAQLLGMDLIATGYSGNMGFCAENDARTVDYRLVDVEEGEYFFGTGQQWAEPDIAQAAGQMRQCVEARLGEPHYATAGFSPTQCGEVYRDRLKVVYEGRFASPASEIKVAPR